LEIWRLYKEAVKNQGLNPVAGVGKTTRYLKERSFFCPNPSFSFGKGQTGCRFIGSCINYGSITYKGLFLVCHGVSAGKSCMEFHPKPSLIHINKQKLWGKSKANT
jgi:hypothetical protein